MNSGSRLGFEQKCMLLKLKEQYQHFSESMFWSAGSPTPFRVLFLLVEKEITDSYRIGVQSLE